MKKIILIVCIFLFSNLWNLSFKIKEINYIEKYKSIAIFEMVKYKIPASIILAQALVESNAGTSELAISAKNHFGIKCKKDWNGKKYYYDDDNKKECFRKYLTIEDSYADHSIFISSRERYKFLFKLNTKDYKGWSIGLQKAGYATDTSYASKLISKIETYKLYLLDI